MLGPRGLYHSIDRGGNGNSKATAKGSQVETIVWLIAYSDGAHTLAEIARNSQVHDEEMNHKVPNKGYVMLATDVDQLMFAAERLLKEHVILQLC